MIAGTFSDNKQGKDNCPEQRAKVNAVFQQLCADDFQPLAEIPYDTREVYKDDLVQLVQQTITHSEPQCIAKCDKTGQVCISWSRLDNVDETKSTLSSGMDIGSNDASLILACYQQWFEECPKHIDGDFAFAVYDPLKQQILLARDRMGVIPLYYNDSNPCFVFASNVAAIAQLDAIDNKLSTFWMAQFIYHYSVDDSHTGFLNIKKLPAGHTLLISTDHENPSPKVQAYWQLEDLLKKTSEQKASEEYVKEYRQVFDQAVASRVSSKEKLGIELSGGLDSSSIMASLMKITPSSNAHCFSRMFFSLEEEPLQALYQQFPGTTNHLWDDPQTDHDVYQKDVSRYIELFGLPEEHSLAVGCFDFLDASSEQGVKTLFSGFGGDEFTTSMARDVMMQLAKERQFFELYLRLTGNPIRRLYSLLKLVFKRQKIKAYQPSMLHFEHPDIIALVKQQKHDYEIFNKETNHNLRRVQSWRQGSVLRLESHTLSGAAKGVSFVWPMLDVKLLACYLSTPVTERLGFGGETRWLHRRAFSKSLPDIIVNKNDKNIGKLVKEIDIHDLLAKRYPNEIKLHPKLKEMVDEQVLNQLLSAPTEIQKQSFVFIHTVKSIYSLNLWLKRYF